MRQEYKSEISVNGFPGGIGVVQFIRAILPDLYRADPTEAIILLSGLVDILVEELEKPADQTEPLAKLLEALKQFQQDGKKTTIEELIDSQEQ